jgi:hypothetical protein
MSEPNVEIRTQVIQVPRAKPGDPPMECYQALPVGDGPFTRSLV